MDDKYVSYTDTVKDIARVLQEFSATGTKYGVFVLEMNKLAVEGNGGIVEITLCFDPVALHGYIAQEVSNA
jgi:hypothetical protein